MNNLKLCFTAALLLFLTVGAYSQSCHGSKSDTPATSKAQTMAADVNLEKVTFLVSGNCGMCKRTIEGAAISVVGVQSASWDQDAKVIAVEYAPEVTNLQLIKEGIAASGYDTEGVQATEEAYSSLPGCCQYERVKL